MPYLLDADVFIGAKNLHYGFDFCPAFWEWLIEQNTLGTVFSIEKIGDQLFAFGDDLSVWAKERGDAFFLPPDEVLLTAFPVVSAWVTSQKTYRQSAINTFLQDADYYLIAHAKAHQFTLVTHEVPANAEKKVKIPNVCIGVGVKCMSPYEMLRTERARFVLGK
jgi:hypothetical protein